MGLVLHKEMFKNPFNFLAKREKYKNRISRDHMILPCFQGFRFYCFNGLKPLKVRLQVNTFGGRFGSYSFTCQIGSEIHARNKSKKKKAGKKVLKKK